MTENTDSLLIDTLYGGIAGQTYIPDTIDDFESVSEHKSGAININVTEDDILETHHALAAVQAEDIDVRPRFWDKIAQQWVLVDTGAQVSVTFPSPADKVDPRVMLEMVDGSKMPSYGTKQAVFKLGRKEYHQPLVITTTNETILGIEVKFVPPYHQQTNGAIERQHRTMKESLKASLIEMETLIKASGCHNCRLRY